MLERLFNGGARATRTGLGGWTMWGEGHSVLCEVLCPCGTTMGWPSRSGPAGRPVSAPLRMRAAPRPGDMPPASGPRLRRLRSAPRAKRARAGLSELASRAPEAADPDPLIESAVGTCRSRLAASRDLRNVRRAHGPSWARCAACRRGVS